MKDSPASARVEARAQSGVGNTVLLDPVIANLKLKRTRIITRTFKKIPQAERYLTLQNATLGLSGLSLWINGKLAYDEKLTGRQTVKLDGARWLKSGKHNVVRVLCTGPKGTSAILSIRDAPVAPPEALAANRELDLEFAP